MGILKKLIRADDTPPPARVTSQPASSGASVPATSPGRVVLRRPVVTEKAMFLKSHNQYVFAVAPDANKMTIATAVEAQYGVRPLAVRLSRLPRKVRTRGRIRGYVPAWKKAIVVLPQGKSIAIQEGG